MQFGATMWFTEYSISPSELAVALQERGFESLWASEHSHLSVPENSPELRKEQADVMDPFLTLTAAAMSTKTLRLGTATRQLQRHSWGWPEYEQWVARDCLNHSLIFP